MKKIFNYTAVLFFIAFITGCYTQVATNDSYSEPVLTSTEVVEYENYYDEGEENIDSGYFSEEEFETDENSTVIINNYYGYPSYRRYYSDYYPSVAFGFAVGVGIGFSVGWGWPYYSYYTPYYYWPYSYGWCGYNWYYPWYCYYPSYYCYAPTYYSYYPGYGYPSHHYKYRTRSDYVYRIRNNTGGRNSGGRGPNSYVTGGNNSRDRNIISTGRDLTVLNDKKVTRDQKTRNLSTDVNPRNTLGNKQDSKFNSTDRDLNRIKTLGVTKTDKRKQLTTDKNTDRKKYLGSTDYRTQTKKLNTNKSFDNKKTLGTRNNTTDKTKLNTRKFNTGNNQVKKNTTNNTRKYDNRFNNSTPPTKKYNTNNGYKPPKKTNTNNGYKPPQRTNNPPKQTYSPPKQTYSPPRTNTTNRTTSPPPSNTRSSGNTSGRRR